MQGYRRSILFTSLGVIVLTASAASGQQPPPPPASSGQPPQQQQAEQGSSLQIDANTIIGSTVRNAQGQDIGKVSRLMIEPQQGRVTNVVIGMGGTLGLGEKLVSVPWNSVKVGQDDGKVIVSVDQQVLQQAPRAAGDRGDERKRDDRGSGSASPATGERKNDKDKNDDKKQ